MSKTQIDRLIKQIREKLPTYETPERCAEIIEDDAINLFGELPEAFVSNLSAAVDTVRSEMVAGIEVLHRSSIIKERAKWYPGPSSTDRHWPALEGYLRNVKGWDPDAVDSIGKSSNEVVSLLANPMEAEFRCRGMVVGFVQSGKTANMTAVIAKAVDAGYNMIVLLGGMTNKLRAQTQRRIVADICMRHRDRWFSYTGDEDHEDFEYPRNGQFRHPVDGYVEIAVMKKITSRLNQFHRTIKSTPPAVLRALKVLIIDDECDQASVNSSKDDFDMTKINEAIRKIINDLPAVSYVGYTATPFANVFINPYPFNRDELDDLYPEDFITSLPRPAEYFGAKEVFGIDTNADRSDNEDMGLDIIRLIDDEEVKHLKPEKASDKDIFHPEVTEMLEDALLWFIASSALRRLRGQGDKHMTMLIHSSPNVIQHERMAEVVGSWISANEDDLRAGHGAISERLAEVLNQELSRVAPRKEAHDIRADASGLLPQIRQVLDALEIAVENGVSDIRLDYTGDARTYVVIGGAVLARGLTLEGLSVSFFLRTSGQYDSLLQMGRWFGYRHGYEDLPRLWTTPDLAANFRALARIEEEIRDDINLYREKDLNPAEFAVRVRSIPGMAITSATKMRSAVRTSISWLGRHVQTIRFEHQNPGIIEANWDAGARLVDAIGAANFHPPRIGKGGRVAEGILLAKVRQFLAGYHISTEHMDLERSTLLSFLDKSADRLSVWNVGVIEAGQDRISGRPLGELGRLRMLNRSKLDGTPDRYADIKALMSKQDVLIDADHEPEDGSNASWSMMKACRPERPLLLLYPVDRNSAPERGGARKPLEATGDLLGIGLVFPGTKDEAGRYYAVELDVPTPEDLDAEEAEDIDNLSHQDD